jgi:hypothetical protein
VTASIRVSRFSLAASRVLRMSAGEKRLKMSSVDSGNSQNCGGVRLVCRQGYGEATHRSPVWIIGGNDSILREPEDAFLEYQLRVGGSHFELRLASAVRLERSCSSLLIHRTGGMFYRDRWNAQITFKTFFTLISHRKRVKCKRVYVRLSSSFHRHNY